MIVKKKEKMIKLELPLITPSNNKLLRTHWAVRRKLKVYYMDEIVTAMIDGGFTDYAEGKRTCEVTSHRKRLLDPDNLTGGIKMLLDALVELKLLKDDSPKWCDLKVGQKKARTPKTVIELKEA